MSSCAVSHCELGTKRDHSAGKQLQFRNIPKVEIMRQFRSQFRLQTHRPDCSHILRKVFGCKALFFFFNGGANRAVREPVTTQACTNAD